MQTLFDKYQTKEEREAEQEFLEWKESKGTSAVKKSLRWSAIMIVGSIAIDALFTLIDGQSPSIKSSIIDNLYVFIFFLFFGAAISWTKNSEFRRKLNEEKRNLIK